MPGYKGHFEGIFYQFAAHVICKCPSYDPAAGQIDDCWKLCPTLPGPDVGYVPYIAGIELLRWCKLGFYRSFSLLA